ncbi:response regulator transcription factor [Subsaxibacter sp. CAU 1640]|uniref:response regulator transcription factor n=1 Tax=Subsaxibacter sp. CAU 1640 TaxID=2933271 RepID=UPI002005370D|nr:response regulator transcription factor [Subsaxibacter sp. CAU 1640]MCK7590635.1 response regulator transcription factor [Subsaxibacter sp. CAU 1640]
MFKKVLLSDDLGGINEGVFATLTQLGIKDIQKVQYCDDAYIRIKKAALDGVPYDLLITDLSFERDYREQSFKSGDELIEILKKEFPKLKIIAFSVDDRLQKIKTILYTYKADGYVGKGRKGLQELLEAIEAIVAGKTYLSPHLENALNAKNDLEIDDYELEILNLLSQGKSQEEISRSLKQLNITPNSVSSIEKKINKLRVQFKSNNAIHLVSTVKDLGLI